MTNRLNEESIIQTETCCWLCGNDNPYALERHEVFFGSFRKKSIKLKLTVLLCGESCHRTGKFAIHGPYGKANNLRLKKAGQKAAMEKYSWSVDDFRREFEKNYLSEPTPVLPERALDIFPDDE